MLCKLQTQYFSNFSVNHGQFIGVHYESYAPTGVLQFTAKDGSGIESLQTFGFNPSADFYNKDLNEGSFFHASLFQNIRTLPMAYFQVTWDGKHLLIYIGL